MSHPRKNPLAWMPLYFRDLRNSETWRLMSHTQRGLYIELMGHQWEEGSIPADIAQVAVLAGAEAWMDDLAVVLRQFPASAAGGRRCNARVAAERDGQLAKYQARAHRMKAARGSQSSGLISGQSSGQILGQISEDEGVEPLLSGQISGLIIGRNCSASASVSSSSALEKKKDARSSAAELPDEVEAALEPYLRPARYPASIRAATAMLLNPEASPHFSAPEVVTALREMQAKGREFGSATLARWCATNRAADPLPVPGSATDDPYEAARIRLEAEDRANGLI